MKKKLIRKVMSIIIALSFLAPTMVANARTLDEIKESGTLIMGTSADYPPFEWNEMVDGKAKVVGADADIAQRIAEELGVELKIEDMAFDSLIPALQTGKIDITLAGMTYSEERAKQVDFSEGYYVSIDKFLVLKDKVDEFKSLDDFKGLKIGVQKGTVQEKKIKDDLPEAKAVSMGKNGMLIDALKSNRVDAIFMDDIVTDEFVNENKDTIAVVPDVQFESYDNAKSAALTKDNKELLEAVNKVIVKLKEDGEIDEILSKNKKAAAELTKSEE